MKNLLALILSLFAAAHSYASEVNGRFYAEGLISDSARLDTIPGRFRDIATVRERMPILRKNGSGGFIPYAAPLIPVFYGILSLNNKAIISLDHQINHEMMEGKTNFSSSVEDKLQYTPLATVYALNALGVRGKNNFVDRTGIYLLAHSVMSFTVGAGKGHLRKERPTGGFRSFPSGHTATAFTAAEFMHQEYKDTSPWIGYAGYSVATLTGILRMEHNKHWLSDVVAGAGVGILSTKLSYVAYPWMKDKLFHERGRIIVVPSFGDRICGLTLDATF